MEHTELPWKLHGNAFNLITSKRRAICAMKNTHSEENEYNAKFIVKACNAYESLIQALRVAETYIAHTEGNEPTGYSSTNALELIKDALTKR